MVYVDAALSVQAKSARTDNGHARRSPGYFTAAEQAENFRGLPETFSHPKQILEPLRRCGARLPFPREALDTLTLLLDFSDPEDWLPGGLPLVFPGNAELAGCLGITERSVRNHLRHLQSAGAIHIRRGPGNRRTPVRDGSGRIAQAYGIDLSPVAALAAVMAEEAAAMKKRRAGLKEFIRSIQASVEALRSDCGAVAACAEEISDPDFADQAAALTAWLEEAECLAGEARRIWSHDPISSREEQEESTARLREIRTYLLDLESKGDALTASLLVSLEKNVSGQAEMNFRLDSTIDSNGSKNQYSASQESVVEDGGNGFKPVTETSEPLFKPPEPSVQTGKAAAEVKGSVRLAHIFEVYPDFTDLLKAYLLVDDPNTASERDIADAARVLALQMGVSDWCWRTGCARHGRLKSALAVIVSAAKPDHEIRKSRAALAAGMLLRASDELNILKSFHALRKRRMT